MNWIKVCCVTLMILQQSCTQYFMARGRYEPPEVFLSGVKLESINSYFCTGLELKNLDRFELCAFARINDDKIYKKTIFWLKDNNSIIELQHDKSEFILLVDKNGTDYMKSVDYGKWIKICFGRNDKNSEKLDHFYDIIGEVPKLHPRESFRPTLLIRKNVILCIGSYYRTYKSMKVEVTGLTLTANEAGHQEPHTDVSCTETFDWKHMVTLESNTTEETDNYIDYTYDAYYWGNPREELPVVNHSHDLFSNTKEKMVNHFQYLPSSVCYDTYVIAHIIDDAYYGEHEHRCRSMSGRLPELEEFFVFAKNILEVSERVISDNRNGEGLKPGTWLAGGNVTATSLRDHCVYATIKTMQNRTGRIYKHDIDARVTACLIEYNYNLCIIPAYADFTLFGDLKKFDRNYFIKERGSSFILDGNEGSVVEKVKQKWNLKSSVHKEFSELTEGILPFGRKTWKHNRKDHPQEITFTKCDLRNFSCSNGECFSHTARCNGAVECSDESDEQNCKLVERKTGYITTRTPKPLKNDTQFNMKYFISVYNVADINSVDGTAVMDVFISFLWRDPGLIFWNPLPNDKVDCDEIWSPVMGMSDGYPSGFQVSFKDYRSSCHVRSTFSDSDPSKTRSFKDPYMGYYIDGEDMDVAFTFSGLVTVPCRFNLRRYPFGKQTCKIAFWPDNVFTITRKYELSFNSYYSKFDNESVMYFGREDLGEYSYLGIYHGLSDNKKIAILTLKLQTLYGFHMLNSFTPSFLISLISYATLFFSVDNFNERVMVSLTALLVLAALFTQASDTSVRTPYFKYLDIWYVFLIFYCFLIVAFNVIIHKIKDMEEKRESKDMQEDANKDNDSVESTLNGKGIKSFAWKNKLDLQNNVAKLVFALLLFLFMLFYCLGASEII